MTKELEIFTEQELNPDAPCLFDLDMVCPYYWTHIPLPCTGCQAYEKEHPKNNRKYVWHLNIIFVNLQRRNNYNMIKRRNITPKHPWHDCNGLALPRNWQRQRAVSVYFYRSYPQ